MNQNEIANGPPNVKGGIDKYCTVGSTDFLNSVFPIFKHENPVGPAEPTTCALLYNVASRDEPAYPEFVTFNVDIPNKYHIYGSGNTVDICSITIKNNRNKIL